MQNPKQIPLPAVVYGVLVALAIAVGVISLGNQAGWWSIGN
jgi:hypothetical protein